MNHLPIFYRIEGKKCLVFGNTEAAFGKVRLLVNAGSHVTLISDLPAPSDIEAHASQGRITIVPSLNLNDIGSDTSLIFASASDISLNNEIAIHASALNIPFHLSNNAEKSTFILPSIIDRAPVTIAISSGGKAPILSRLLRGKLEASIPSQYGRLAVIAEKFKDAVKAKFKNTEERRAFWEGIFNSNLSEMVFSGRERQAEDYLSKKLSSPQTGNNCGEVYLVGAGPGNPDLLTFRALRLMQQADIVVYDRLVSKPILDLCRRDAEFIYVGKERDNHAVPQDQINTLLANLALKGKRVVRLKGGDPFIFGRGGEEIETLREFDVPFQVVPAITAAAGVASYAGIPLTHRDYSQALILVTGHLKDNTMDLDWDMLCRPHQTIVIYMGLKGIKTLCTEMIKHGMPADMPAAIIQQGTTLNQKVVIGNLNNLPVLAITEQLKPPTLIIVGEVVKLHEKLKWYEPLDEVKGE